jgi:methionyl-tRNA formyltransferase
LAGDEETGVCLMAVEEGLDTGGVYGRTHVPIGADTTAADLRATLVEEGSRLLVDLLTIGLGEPEPQVGEITYAAKLSAVDLELHWERSPIELHRIVRVGGATTRFRGARLKVIAADLIGDRPDDVLVGDVVGGLRLRAVQPEGKRIMSFAEWANGVRPQPGERLG